MLYDRLMKKLLVILVLSLLWCNVSYSDDLKGKKIFCHPVGSLPNYMSFEFKSFSKVEVIDITPYASDDYLGKESYTVTSHKYETTIQHIIIKNFKNVDEIKLGRKNLTLMSYQGYSCDLTSKNENLRKKMKNIHNKLIIKAKSKNKI